MRLVNLLENYINPQKTYYHGTNNKFNDFDLDATKENRGTNVTGVYFTPRESEARNFGNRVIAANLVVKEPFFNNKKNSISTPMLDEYREMLLRFTSMREHWIDSVKLPEFEEKGIFSHSMFDLNGDIKREILIAGGYDSYIDGDHVVVLHPKQQIKVIGEME